MTANAHPKVISSQSPLAMKMVVGVAALPLGAPVEVEAVVEIA